MIGTVIYCDKCNTSQVLSVTGCYHGCLELALDWGWKEINGKHICLDCLEKA